MSSETGPAGLTPIRGDEAPVDELILWVHLTACGEHAKDLHDPLCNTMRLLAEDQRHLARHVRHATPGQGRQESTLLGAVWPTGDAS